MHCAMQCRMVWHSTAECNAVLYSAWNSTLYHRVIRCYAAQTTDAFAASECSTCCLWAMIEYMGSTATVYGGE